MKIKAWVEQRLNERKVSWEMLPEERTRLTTEPILKFPKALKPEQQPEEGGPREMPSFSHGYQVVGSLTQMKLIPMKAVRGLRQLGVAPSLKAYLYTYKVHNISC